jgi:predicted Zn-dependent protease
MLSEQKSNPSAVENWFASHPSDQSRIEDTQRLIDQIDPSVLKGLTQDTQAFHDFQNRVKGLPKP